METEFGGLLLEVGDAAGWSGRGSFEGFRFVVIHAAGNDRVADAGEFMRGGGEGQIKGQVSYRSRTAGPASCPSGRSPPPGACAKI